MVQTLVSRCDPVDSTFSLPFLAQLGDYLQPFAGIFPDRRLFCRFAQAVKGVIAASVPIVSRMAAAVLQSRDPKRTFHVAKRFYRWLTNPRFQHPVLLKPAYAQTRTLFQNETEPYTPVLLDFTNLEKPYGYCFEALSTLKASGLRTGPRCREGKVPGYNQLVGLALGEKKVGLTYAKTISYNTPDFVSLNREIFRAIRYSHVILSGRRLRFICDRGFDDEKTFAFVRGLEEEFVIRLYHNRTLWVLQGKEWVEQSLEEIVRTLPRPVRFEAPFKVRGCWHRCRVTLGYCEVRLPGDERPYWLVVSEVYGLNQRWVLLTNVPVTGPERAREIWRDYRRRWRIEETFRFLQREGLRWEDFKVLSLEAIRRLVSVVLIAALFLLNLSLWVDEKAHQALLVLGGKLGLKSERDGPYLALRGWQKLLNGLTPLAVLKQYDQLETLLQALDAL